MMHSDRLFHASARGSEYRRCAQAGRLYLVHIGGAVRRLAHCAFTAVTFRPLAGANRIMSRAHVRSGPSQRAHSECSLRRARV